ncbi:Cilia- and flagella-associated protein 44, partial [Lamellibrachia satsuma]
SSMAMTMTSIKDHMQSVTEQMLATDEVGDEADTSISPLKSKLQQVEHIKLIYKRDHIRSHINELITNFDAELRCLRHDKFKMDVDMKNADLKEVTLFEELQLLKEFEKFENEMEEKVENKMMEKLQMMEKIEDVQIKLEFKKKDIDKLIEKDKLLNANFVASLGDNNKFAEYLMKVFKKRIKRSKKKSSDNEDSEDESDEDSDDDSDWSESEEESDSESGGLDLDVCPPGCDAAIYESACKLREKRLDIEESLSEEKRLKDLLNKELDMLQKKAKIIVAALKAAEDELEAFQLEKQRKLNELDVVVILKLHQILHISNASIAPDLTPCLVFESYNVVKLAHRIKELEQEKGMQKEQKKEARKKHLQLIKDRHRFETQIKQMQEQCDKMMMQKFGRIVDLEILETVTVNRQLEELKEKLRLLELQCARETAKWDTYIEDAKDEITRLIQENTDKLDQMNMLIVEKKSYEKDLDARQKALGSEYSGPRKTELIERKRLIQLVQLQAQEVEALKDEILLLSRKGGHILPPAQPPIPHSPHMRSTLPPI